MDKGRRCSIKGLIISGVRGGSEQMLTPKYDIEAYDTQYCYSCHSSADK